nr:inositol monophosphatase family protein [Ruegeria sp. HKCCD8929]
MDQDRSEMFNRRHSDNFLSAIDIELHEVYRREIAKIIPECIYASEEGDAEYLTENRSGSPEFIAIIDPLDTSELAVRGLNGYTQVAVYSIQQKRPIVAVVGDMFHEIRLYCGAITNDGREVAFARTRSGAVHELKCKRDVAINQAILTSYFMRPKERFNVVALENDLLNALAEENADGQRRGRIGIDFGSAGLCHVASGGTDAFIEIAKGFWLWDLYPGHFILEASGGTVVDLAGNKLSLSLPSSLEGMRCAMRKRQKFVSASSEVLAKSIASKLN